MTTPYKLIWLARPISIRAMAGCCWNPSRTCGVAAFLRLIWAMLWHCVFLIRSARRIVRRDFGRKSNMREVHMSEEKLTKRQLTIRKLEALAESTTHASEAEAAKAKAEQMKPIRMEVQVG